MLSRPPAAVTRPGLAPLAPGWDPVPMDSFTRPNIQPTDSFGTPSAASGDGYLLVAGRTYYFEIPPATGPRTALQSLHAVFDSASIITSLEVESSNLPSVSLTSTTVGEWIKENPTGAYVACVGNCTATLLVVAKTAGAIGASMAHLGNLGCHSARAKVVVGSVGGVARFATYGKS